MVRWCFSKMDGAGCGGHCGEDGEVVFLEDGRCEEGGEWKWTGNVWRDLNGQCVNRGQFVSGMGRESMSRIDGGVLPHLFCFVFYVLVSGQPVYAKDVFLHLSAFLFICIRLMDLHLMIIRINSIVFSLYREKK